MTTIGSNASSIAQLQSLLALQTALSSGSAGSAGSATGASFSSVLQTLASQLASPSSSDAVAPGMTGAAIVADARRYLGVPYVLGGTTTSGMDCSGLVQTVFHDLGDQGMPRDLSKQMTQGTEVPSLAEAQPGDLIVFKGGGHIGIYAGDGKVIHAPYPGRTVSEQKLWTDDSGIETIRRIAPSDLAGGSAPGNPSAIDPSTASSTSAAFLLGLSLGGSGLLGSGALGSGTSTTTDPTVLARLLTMQSALAVSANPGSDA
ncbi:C40 family peptidase [Mesorhizobium japonicum]|uniref:C40 family peptidase n=1 Tax=Mesorhizobium japonicum TaxID=2066070 RepID=UPI003B58D89C